MHGWVKGIGDVVDLMRQSHEMWEKWLLVELKQTRMNTALKMHQTSIIPSELVG